MVEKKVCDWHKELGTRLVQLAGISGVAVSTMAEIEKGMEPKNTTARCTAETLNKTTDELWPR